MLRKNIFLRVFETDFDSRVYDNIDDDKKMGLKIHDMGHCVRQSVTVARNGHHDLRGSPSYPTCLTIGNLGDLTIMGELSRVAILFHRYCTKYHLRLG